MEGTSHILDYEVEEAKEWQLDATCEEPIDTSTPEARPDPTGGETIDSSTKNAFSFALDAIHAAADKWRKMQRPDALIYFPKDFPPQISTADEDNEDSYSLYERYPEVQEISIKTCTYIALMPDQAGIHGPTFSLGVWGTRQAAQLAKRLLVALIRQSQTQATKAGKAGYAKKPPLATQKPKQTWQEKVLENVRLQQFVRVMPRTYEWKSMGIFQWPAESGGMGPTDLFGLNLCALDSIRTHNQCFISFDPARSALKVAGECESSVRKAVDQIQIAYLQKRTLVVDQMRRWLLKPVHDSDAQVYFSLNSNNLRCFPVLMGHKEQDIDSQTTDLSGAQDDYGRLEEALHASLLAVRHYSGHIVMRARLGMCFVDSSSSGKVFLIENFKKMLEGGQIAESVRLVTEEPDERQHSIVRPMYSRIVTTPRLLTKSGLKAKIRDARDALSPIGLPAVEIHKIRPEFAVTFMLNYPGDDILATLRIEFRHEVEKEKYYREEMWTMAGCADEIRADFSRITWIDLERPSTWRFEIRELGTLSQMWVPVMRRFADSLCLHVPLDVLRLGLAVEKPLFRPNRRFPDVQILQYDQETIWKYALKDTPYTVEVCNVQKFAVEPLEQPGSQTFPINDSTWEVFITCATWDQLLGENVDLPVGETVSWKGTVEEFFPAEGSGDAARKQGFSDFIKAMKRVEDMLLSVP